MKYILTADRFRLWLMVALLAVVALGSFWVLEVMRRNNEEGNSRSAPRTAPDYYVENFNFVRLSNDGKSNYHITGKRMTHRPRDDDYEIEQPRINSFDDDKTPVTVIADRAVIEQKNTPAHPAKDSDEVHLFGNVSVERPDSPTSKGMKLESEYLLLLPDINIMKTDKPVTLTSASAEIHAIGMEADNNTQEMKLLHKVRAILSRVPASPQLLNK
ncbi:LPS export ABC transporter periplasmic protein LptC [Undibacterium sp.]|jgi:lipopolysaccharide export system protein LptC|uniref:LPS export ABC transporter periplasmic protein LptC n=1 Tax=Undibacterium sp. TaxID=1914977 RepID=UPI002BBB4A1D|nr:LPS export ABC transporter periplasmic protein LptC [Undibacterium sp.]HTD04711.1 LPS export ABC transporter periplasmic protein LptC [Undibacterium sp.]